MIAETQLAAVHIEGSAWCGFPYAPGTCSAGCDDAGTGERGVWISDPAARHDLVVFAERARALDEAAVIRLRSRADGLIGAWVATGFDVLAGRAVAGTIQPADLTCAAEGIGPWAPCCGRVGICRSRLPAGLGLAWCAARRERIRPRRRRPGDGAGRPGGARCRLAGVRRPRPTGVAAGFRRAASLATVRRSTSRCAACSPWPRCGSCPRIRPRRRWCGSDVTRLVTHRRPIRIGLPAAPGTGTVGPVGP